MQLYVVKEKVKFFRLSKGATATPSVKKWTFILEGFEQKNSCSKKTFDKKNSTTFAPAVSSGADGGTFFLKAPAFR